MGVSATLPSLSQITSVRFAQSAQQHSAGRARRRIDGLDWAGCTAAACARASVVLLSQAAKAPVAQSPLSSALCWSLPLPLRRQLINTALRANHHIARLRARALVAVALQSNRPPRTYKRRKPRRKKHTPPTAPVAHRTHTHRHTAPRPGSRTCGPLFSYLFPPPSAPLPPLSHSPPYKTNHRVQQQLSHAHWRSHTDESTTTLLASTKWRTTSCFNNLLVPVIPGASVRVIIKRASRARETRSKLSEES
jgi:hypothetical protein